MDQVDLALLKSLEHNARLSFAELADAQGMSKTPIWKRVKALEEAGVITGYEARLAPKAMGFGLSAFVEVVLDFESSDAFETAVARHPSIWRCHATTGDADYLLQLFARDMDDMDKLIRAEIARFPGVRRTSTTVVTRSIKENQSLAALAQTR
ncbi:Lrp/AsnC family transcriptional regulator [Pacificibacter marinus]|uniref:Leucine-responsive regulatory protein n=1 Tax=Pacificibacter marinus TaxID=658057 RepID=A0A1Y5S9B0_9RHOB|nr:Lrp/AsnC family transcriptional regulator [Pacificibacter marinus]SEK77058.1 transcriptional regulator, AsnC family [Pacificibacter marinus]SLN34285.1 Leucine-responsive regulatory protein [Pacificibacter marinus]